MNGPPLLIARVAATDGGLATDSVALAFQMRAIPKKCLKTFVRALTIEELTRMGTHKPERFNQVLERSIRLSHRGIDGPEAVFD